MVRRLVLRILAFTTVVGLIGACSGLEAPPVPDATRIPTIVGVIAERAPDNLSYRLKDGTIVDVGGPNASAEPAELMSQPFAIGDGSLLLFGEDPQGRFYAATWPRDAQGCFEINGQGYIDPDRIHYSKGLVVPFAAEIERKNDRYYYDPAWLLESDVVCLDEAGQVTSIYQLSLGI